MKYTDEMRQADYKVVFGSPTGQKVLTDILTKASVFTPINHPDSKECLRMEGARQLALHIASFIRFDAKSFQAAWKETDDL